jgi:hypothetical protein
MTPSAQQSMAMVYELRCIISGAKYPFCIRMSEGINARDFWPNQWGGEEGGQSVNDIAPISE